jgi:hypothetical protein
MERYTIHIFVENKKLATRKLINTLLLITFLL